MIASSADVASNCPVRGAQASATSRRGGEVAQISRFSTGGVSEEYVPTIPEGGAGDGAWVADESGSVDVPESAVGATDAGRERLLREAEALASSSEATKTRSAFKPSSMCFKLLTELAKQRSIDPDEFNVRVGMIALAAKDVDSKLEHLVGQPSVMPASFDPPVEVRDCGSRGVGVFATRDIAEGEVVTYYAGRVVRLADVAFLSFGQMVFQSNRFCLNGDPRCLDPRACGQLVNDAHAFAETRNKADAFWDVPGQATLLELKGEGVMMDMRAEYWIEALAHAAVYTCKVLQRENVESDIRWGPDGSIVSCMKSYKAIAAGEEILMSYGVGYWLAKSLAMTDRHLMQPQFFDDLVEASHRLVTLNRSDNTFFPPGTHLLLLATRVFSELEEFKKRVDGDKFFRTSYHRLHQAVSRSWRKGEYRFDVAAFMRDWRAWRDATVARG